MDAAYLKAAVPEPFRILGKNLRPFALGHEILLQRYRNRFSIESTDEPGIRDLLIGVHVCSQRVERVTLENFRIPIKVKAYSQFLGPSYLNNALSLFRCYIIEHATIPDFVQDAAGGGGGGGAPLIQAVKTSLMANLSLSEIEALNTPFALAFWNHLSFLESRGEEYRNLRIIDEAELERRKIADKAKAEAEPWIEEMRKKMQQEAFGA